MKIRPKVVEAQQEALRLEQQKGLLRSGDRTAAEAKKHSENSRDTDTVHLDLAKAIRGDNDEEERRKKIAKIKELVERGEYRIETKAVAEKLSKAVDEEIFFERLINGDF